MTRVAFLLPSLERGYYWHPVLASFVREFKETKVFTAAWPGYLDGYKDTFDVVKVGRLALFRVRQHGHGYNSAFTCLSPRIIIELVKFRPKVIFSSAFTLWSLFAVFMKSVFAWKIIIMYEGSSPTVDSHYSTVKMILRRYIATHADRFVTNTSAGLRYLSESLRIPKTRIQLGLYEVPHSIFRHAGLARNSKSGGEVLRFLFVGSLSIRKGIPTILSALNNLFERFAGQFTMTIIGDGPLADDVRGAQARMPEGTIRWYPTVPYNEVWLHHASADVFVFPSKEDVLGLAPLEAMAAGLPVLCSRYCGAAEFVVEGVNGFIIDPGEPSQVVERMGWFILNPSKIPAMACAAQETMRPYTIECATSIFRDIVWELNSHQKDDHRSSRT